MYLVPFSALQERFGLSANDDICMKGTNAITTATVFIEEFIRTYFIREEATDIFKVDSEHHPLNEADIVLVLRKGAVVKESVVITTHSTLAGDKVTLDSSTYLVSEDGVITIPADSQPEADYFNRSGYDKSYITVDYEAGYEADEDGTYQEVPVYLTEAALLVANHIFMDEEGCGSDDCVQGMSKIISGILTRHIRYYPVGRKPL